MNDSPDLVLRREAIPLAEMVVFRVPPEATLVEVAQLLGQVNKTCNLDWQGQVGGLADDWGRTSCVVITEDDRPVGIITERDLVRWAAEGRSFQHTSAGAIASRNLITISLDTARDPFAIITLFQQHRIRHLPILDNTGTLAGIATPDSVRANLQPADLLTLRRVSDVMERSVITIAAHASVAEAAQQLATHRISCIVVCLGSPADSPEPPIPTGLITERDIVQLQCLGLDLYTLRVGDVASDPPPTIAADATLWDAHNQMTTLGVRRLVVCDDAGNLTGLITPTRLLQVLDPAELYTTVQALQHALSQLQDRQRDYLTRENTRLKDTLADVTEQQTVTAAALQTSRTFSDTILDTTSSLIMVLDAQGQIVRFNRACERLTGYSAQEVVGQYPWECLVPAAQGERMQQAFQSLLQRSPPTSLHQAAPATPLECEQLWQTRTGQQRLIRCSNAVLRDPAGMPIHLICTGIDETERRQAERACQASQTAYRELTQQLEARVAERTHTLAETNVRLEQAIATGQRHADALQATQAQLQFLLTASPAVLYRCRATPPFNVITISDNFERIWGHSEQQCWEMPDLWANSLHPDDRPTISIALEGALSDPTTAIHRYEYRFRHADGTYHWVLDEFRILRDQAGQAVELVGYFIEIDSRKQTEQQLQATNATLNALLDAIPESIFAINQAGTIFHVNATAAQRLGSTPDQLLGTSLYEAFAPDVAGQRRAGNDRVFTTGQPLHNRDRRDDRIFETWVYPIRGDRQQVERVAIFSQDITQQQQTAQALQTSERRFRAIFEQADAGIVLASLQGRFLLTNQKFQDWLGYSAAELQTMNIIDLTHPDDQTRSLETIAQIKRGEERGFKIEKRYLRRDGTVVWGYLSGAVVFNDHGQADYLVACVFDISDRQRTAANLQQLTSTLLEAERIAHIGHWSFDPRTEAITWAEEIFRIYGRDPNAGVPGYTELYELIHPEDREYHRQQVDAALAAKSRFRVEFRVVRPSGEVRHVESRGHITCDETGQVTRLFGMVVDITERKQADAALHASEYRHRMLLEHLPAAVYTATLASPHITTYVSPYIENLLGYTPQEWINNPNFWVDRLHPDDRERVLATLAQSLTQQTNFLAEYRMMHRDGQVMWLRDSATVLNDLQDNPLYLQGVLLDISDRQAAEEALRINEERYALATTGGQVGVWDWDLQAQTFYISPVLKAILGYADHEIPNDLAVWSALVHPQDQAWVIAATQEHLAGRSPAYDVEHRMIHKDGSIRWIRAQGLAFHDAQGTPYRMVGSDTDITKRKLAELALEAANTQLAQSLADLERNHRDLVALGQLMEFLQACDNFQEVSNTIPAFLHRLFPECAGGIFLYQPETRMMQEIATFGDWISPRKHFPIEDCWALHREHPHAVHPSPMHDCCPHIRGDRDPQSPDLPPPDLSPLDPRSHDLCVPMIVRGRVFGLLYLRCPRSALLDAIAQQVARTAAEQIALVLANLQLRQQLREDSIRDSLTGLYNRRYLEEFLARELARVARSHQSLSVWMIDIDHFKQFNDRFGHEAGDQVLRAIARLLKQHVRTSDIACRYGGEELTAILPAINSTTARQRAEGFRQAVANLTLHHQDQDLGHVTVSLGIATYREHGETVIALLRQADTALYQAKAAGRNRVVVAPPSANLPDSAGA
jgi:diguanylate cyclase (GGDEF)-like protein/PAS domain S-box-containing protein